MRALYIKMGGLVYKKVGSCICGDETDEGSMRSPLIMVHGLTSRYNAVLFTCAFVDHGCDRLHGMPKKEKRPPAGVHYSGRCGSRRREVWGSHAGGVEVSCGRLWWCFEASTRLEARGIGGFVLDFLLLHLCPGKFPRCISAVECRAEECPRSSRSFLWEAGEIFAIDCYPWDCFWTPEKKVSSR